MQYFWSVTFVSPFCLSFLLLGSPRQVLYDKNNNTQDLGFLSVKNQGLAGLSAKNDNMPVLGFLGSKPQGHTVLSAKNVKNQGLSLAVLSSKSKNIENQGSQVSSAKSVKTRPIQKGETAF